MKKVALCSLLVCLGTGFAYGAQCNKTITFSKANNNHNAGSNEYLFPSEQEYNKAVNTGYVYECDSDHCKDQTYVSLPANHVFKGSTITTPAKYKCNTTKTDDYWEKVDNVSGLIQCDSSKQWRWTSDFGIDKATMNAEANEYLYKTVTDYNSLKGRVYAQVYECDSSSTTCGNGTTVTLPSGHVFKRQTIYKKRTYKCVLASGDDQWVDITDDCPDCGDAGKYCEVDGVKYSIGKDIRNNLSCATFANLPMLKNVSGIKDLQTGDKCKVSCLEKKADKKPTVVAYISKCPDGTKEVEMDKGVYSPEPNGYKKCVVDGACAKYANHPEALACCRYKYANWNDSAERCDCTNKKANWYYNSSKKTGFCKVPGEPDPVDPVPPVDPNPNPQQLCYYEFNAELRCANGAYLAKHTRYPFNVNTNGKTCDDFKAMYTSDQEFLLRMLTEFCSQNGSTPVVSDDKAFNAAKESMNKFFQTAKNDASVWKNSDGKFNTARLASDLTAGVVLGTVGGVVSGVVIKKKQIEKGFDVLHCTVGGQKVADWGDEFSVGLRK